MKHQRNEEEEHAMTDRYTKIVLTVIAVALCVIAVRGASPSALAVGNECGSFSYEPCYVKVTNPYDFPR